MKGAPAGSIQGAASISFKGSQAELWDTGEMRDQPTEGN